MVIGTCGAMDNASDYGSEDSRFESWQVRSFCHYVQVYSLYSRHAIQQNECMYKLYISFNDVLIIECVGVWGLHFHI